MDTVSRTSSLNYTPTKEGEHRPLFHIEFPPGRLTLYISDLLTLIRKFLLLATIPTHFPQHQNDKD